jgi:uncharacterized protein
MPQGRISSTQLAEFASQGLTRHLSLAVRALPRLREALGTEQGEQGSDAVTADVRFVRGPEGFPQLDMVVAAHLQVRCQRCLQPMGCEVALEPTLTVLENEGQTANLASPFDSVVLHEGQMDLAEVIEDELLAALPLAPMHPEVGQCGVPAVTGDEAAPKSPESHRPFGDLAALLERGRDRAG